MECVGYGRCPLSDSCEQVSGLWNATVSYMRSQRITKTPPLLRQHLTVDNGTSSSSTATLTWDRSYYYTNFEIGYLPFFRSEPYQSYFRHLDSEGGFYYYRWGDAPIRLLGVCVCVCVCVCVLCVCVCVCPEANARTCTHARTHTQGCLYTRRRDRYTVSMTSLTATKSTSFFPTPDLNPGIYMETIRTPFRRHPLQPQSLCLTSLQHSHSQARHIDEIRSHCTCLHLRP
jgi:hypothetical protein